MTPGLGGGGGDVVHGDLPGVAVHNSEEGGVTPLQDGLVLALSGLWGGKVLAIEKKN